MIVKVIKARQAGSGRGLAEYVLALKSEGERLGPYKDDPKHTEKVEWDRTVNTNADTARATISAIEQHNSNNLRKHSKSRWVHIVVSFGDGERPDQRQMAVIEDRLLQAIGFGDHPRISAVHSNTKDADTGGYRHLHIAVTRIDPTTFKAEHPRHNHFKLQAEAARLEIELGLRQERKTLLPRERREIDKRIFLDQQKFDGRALAQFAESHGREDEYVPAPKFPAPTKTIEPRISGDEEFSRRLMQIIVAASLEREPREQARILVVETGAAIDEFDGDRSLTTALALDLMRVIKDSAPQPDPVTPLLAATGEAIQRHTERMRLLAVSDAVREEKQKALEKARWLDHVPSGLRQLTVQDVARRLSPEYDQLMVKADKLEKSLRKGGIRYNPLTQKNVNMQKTIDDREADVRLADYRLAERAKEMTFLRRGLHHIGQHLEPHPYRRGESFTIRLGRILRDTEMTKWEKFKGQAEYTHYAYQAHLAAMQGEFNVAIRAAEEVFNGKFRPGIKLHEAAERELARLHQAARVARDELKQQQKIAQHAREPLVSLDENAIQKQTRVHKRGLAL